MKQPGTNGFTGFKPADRVCVFIWMGFIIAFATFLASCGTTEKVNREEIIVEKTEVQRPENYETLNELWTQIIPVFHHRGPQGSRAIYLYDDGSFIEKNVKQISGEKYTREGVYYYEPEIDKVNLIYTDNKHRTKKYEYLPEKQTLPRPKPIGDTSLNQVVGSKRRPLEGREKAEYINQ